MTNKLLLEEIGALQARVKTLLERQYDISNLAAILHTWATYKDGAELDPAQVAQVVMRIIAISERE